MAQCLDLSKPHQEFVLKKELMYCTPTSHRELLEVIVVSDIPRLKKLLSNAMAISIRVDGSVDKFQIDNKFVMLKIVTPECLFFLDLKS